MLHIQQQQPPHENPCGEGMLGSPRSVLDAQKQQRATLEDRGVRGAFLCCGGKELPLAFADIDVRGLPFVQTTSNGTRALRLARDAARTTAACLRHRAPVLQPLPPLAPATAL